MSAAAWNDPDGETQHEATLRGEVDTGTPIPALSLAFHPETDRVGERKLIGSEGLDLCRGLPYFHHPRGGPQHALDLQRVSRKPFRLSPRRDGSVVVERLGSSSSLEIDGVVVEDRSTVSADQVDRGAVLVLARSCVLLLHRVEPRPPAASDHDMVGTSSALEAVRHAVERFADSEKPVLIRGESGTGKELVARALHRNSRRRESRWVTVNMGAVGRDVAPSEMFGSVQGAFTGASKERGGFFQEADRGTLFLDEIGTAGPALQALLLRALESGEVQKVGAGRAEKVDVRVLSATDADLEAMIEQGTFSQALSARLGLLTIDLPALRTRREDIGPLFFRFLSRELERHGETFRLDPERNGRPWIGVELIKTLLDAPWPGNIRELKSVAEQVALLNRGEDRVRQLPDTLRRQASIEASTPAPTPNREPRDAAPNKPRRDPASLDRRTLEDALRLNGWEIKATAEQLQIGRSSLHGLIKRHGLPIAGELSRDRILAAEQIHGADFAAVADTLKVGLKGLKDRRRRLGLSLTRAELREAVRAVRQEHPELDAEERVEYLTGRLKVENSDLLRHRLQDFELEP